MASILSRIRRSLAESKRVTLPAPAIPGHRPEPKADKQWKSSSSDVSAQNPYVYSSGRWLHKEQERLASRHLDFDFPALLKAAVRVRPGAKNVTRYEKFEGGFNRAFVLYLDDGSRLVARIPFRHAGAPRLRTDSEVATIAYLHEKTKIPLPTVLAWSDNPENAVGAEYIIMEHAPGVQLHTHWPKMDGRQHVDCIHTLVGYMRDMSRLAFPAYGCLYFNDAPLPAASKIDIGDGFVIGPNCHPSYWHTAAEPRNYNRKSPNQGPWRNLGEFARGLLDNGYSQLPESQPIPMPDYHGSIATHLLLLDTSEKVLGQLVEAPQIQEISAPLLLHSDLHKRNVFVCDSGRQITALIDWQFAGIAPTFSYATDTPDFLFLYDHIDNLVTQEIGENADKDARLERSKKIQQRIELCQKIFTTCIRGWMPTLWKARQTDQTLLRPFDYCGSSWRDSAPALRQELIDLSRQWSSLGIPGTCPYQPSRQAFEEHATQYADFEHVMDTKHVLTEIVRCDSDGWVNNDTYEIAKELCHDVYLTYLTTIKEGKKIGMSEQKAIELWPFDAR